eukprot:TRINITY_DN1086_c0_g1_i4.p1 TRINITY_DN1086_c0_g1~~TRINITY_DN1086_c0_g1_i4.p1  ORF type:complete len:249 (-),score=41.32 TRINITY_DN1086_c0_g1_i4:318-1064(-)
MNDSLGFLHRKKKTKWALDLEHDQLTPQQQKEEQLFVIIYQLTKAANFFDKVNLQDIVSLAVTSSHIFKRLSPVIADHYTLHFHRLTPMRFCRPKRLLFSEHQLGRNLLELNDPLLSSLWKITFSDDWNYSVTKLPASVTHVQFGVNFNNSYIMLPLHPHITHIFFGFRFNQPISTANLPLNLTHLSFGYCFRQIISSLPPNVQQVTFSRQYNQPIDHLSKDIQFLVVMYEGSNNPVPYRYNHNQAPR